MSDPTTPTPLEAKVGALAASQDPATARSGAAPRGPDRRSRPTPRFSIWTLGGGRRRGARREGEAENAFVDVYDARMLALLMWIALTNVADSFFTMVHLQGGGSEANPVADLLLMTGR